MAPAHVMVTSSGLMPGVMLEVDTEDKALTAEPDGYMTVMWHKIDAVQMPKAQTRTRTIVGWIVLASIVALFAWLAWAQQSSRPGVVPRA